MKLNKLFLKHKKLFNRYLMLDKHGLSVYAFENIYIWRGLFDIRWTVIKDNLCIFFKDKIGCFAYLPALGENFEPSVIKKMFEIMDGINVNKDVSRIENVEEGNIAYFKDLGYSCDYKFSEYLCERKALAELKGNKFKSKRACVNYFTKHYNFEYFDFSLKQKAACLKLYDHWRKERESRIQDPVYRGMLSDSRACLKILLNNYRKLGFAGKVVEVDKKIRAFSFGFELNKDTFCILYEIADLALSGLAQFIFREFCFQLKGYEFINIMDDSGLENLKRVKLSYHPLKLIPAYIVKRGNG